MWSYKTKIHDSAHGEKKTKESMHIKTAKGYAHRKQKKKKKKKKCP